WSFYFLWLCPFLLSSGSEPGNLDGLVDSRPYQPCLHSAARPRIGSRVAMFYLLHGDDEFTNRDQLKKLRQQGNFEFNQDTYNGAEVDLTTLIITTNTMPFLTEQRLVIVEGLPKRKRSETANGTMSSPDTATSVGAHFIAPSDDDAPKNTKSSKPKKSKKNAALTRAGFE